MDIHVAERRVGGRAVVVDAKHFKVAHLNRNEVETTFDYKRRSRAAATLIVVSGSTVVPDSVQAYADGLGVDIIEADDEFEYSIESYFEGLLIGWAA